MGYMKRLFEDVEVYIREGYSNEEISDALNIGEDQVECVREVLIGDE